MRTRGILTATFSLSFVGLLTCASFAQQGVGDKVSETVQDVGRTLRRGVDDFGDAVRKRFESVRTDVNRMEAHSRVYSRLRWDKALHLSKFDVHMLRDGTVLLQGVVPDAEARRRAVELARDTVGVTAVIDDLTTLTVSKAARPAPATR